MSRPPLPPFTAETAAQKARLAEDAWNSPRSARRSRWPIRWTAAGATGPSSWSAARPSSRSSHANGIASSTTGSSRSCGPINGNRIAVRFAYEYHDDSGQWFRSYGNENWEFDEEGLMRLRIASINDTRSRSPSASIIGRSAAGRTITLR